ncbi:MAG: hypothetical protein AAF539_14280, partial [Planctomycetota bacterium]
AIGPGTPPFPDPAGMKGLIKLTRTNEFVRKGLRDERPIFSRKAFDPARVRIRWVRGLPQRQRMTT